jgi:putative N6-adenine-specific DNA methylase
MIEMETNPDVFRGNSKFTITVKTMAGLEQSLLKEVEALGIKDVKVGLRHLSFEGTTEDLYRSCLYLRTAVRVLVPIASFKAFTPERMYKKFLQFDWTSWMTLDQTFAIDATVHSELFRHSHYAALKVKDAIADHFREKFDKRPSVDVESPDIGWDIHIDKQYVRLSLNASGASLHKRGYRIAGAQAPLSEVLAAGLVDLSGWDPSQTLWNPMCGTGTIAIEAARLAAGLPPHMPGRKFGFETWNGFDKELWQKIRENAFIAKPASKIYAGDSDIGVLALAKKHANLAGVGDIIDFKRQDFFGSKVPADKGIMIINPPYGERITIADDFYEKIGDQLKSSCAGWNAFIISTMDKLKKIGLRPSSKTRVFNGALECRYNKFELYDGSRRAKYNKPPEEEKK